MSTPFTPPSGEPQTNAPEINVTPGFEEHLRSFWAKNGKLVIVVCVVILLAIVGRGVMALVSAQRERGIADAYAAAGTSDQLKSFAASHEGHALAGAAHLRLADEAYLAGKFGEAQASYEKAAANLKDPAFVGRIQLGLAMTRLQAGQTAAAEGAFKALADDTTQLKAVRAEAAYHLAVLASDAGRTEEAAKLADQVMSVDPDSIWTQRSLMLRSRIPTAPTAAVTAPAAPAAANSEIVPSVSFKAGAGK